MYIKIAAINFKNPKYNFDNKMKCKKSNMQTISVKTFICVLNPLGKRRRKAKIKKLIELPRYKKKKSILLVYSTRRKKSTLLSEP